jgi:hypothetical protein
MTSELVSQLGSGFQRLVEMESGNISQSST